MAEISESVAKALQNAAELAELDHGIDEVAIPNGFICPLTTEIMRDPVLAADGHSYERAEIEAWFRRGKVTSPKTNDPLPNLNLVENINLKQSIETFLKDQANAARSNQQELDLVKQENIALKATIVQLQQAVQDKSESQKTLRNQKRALQTELEAITAKEAAQREKFALTIKELQGLRITLQANEQQIMTLTQQQKLLQQETTRYAAQSQDLIASKELIEKQRLQLQEITQKAVALEQEITQKEADYADRLAKIQQQLAMTDSVLRRFLIKDGIIVDDTISALQIYQTQQLQSYQKSLEFYSTGKVTEALSIFEKLAEDQNFYYYPALCLKIIFYKNATLNAQLKTYYALVIQQNIDWYTKEAGAAKAHQQTQAIYIDALYNMGILYSILDLPNLNLHDYAIARCYFIKAADCNHAMANFQLGLIYKNGLGVKINYPKAFALFFKSSVLGYDNAQAELKYFIYMGLFKKMVLPKEFSAEQTDPILNKMREWFASLSTCKNRIHFLAPEAKAAQAEYEALLRRFDSFDNLPELLDFMQRSILIERPIHPYYRAVAFKLWQMYNLGIGTVQNKKYATEFLLPSLSSYHELLTQNISDLTPYLLYDLAHLEALLVSNHIEEVLTFMKRAADLGYAPAQYDFACFLVGMKKDYVLYSKMITTLLQADIAEYVREFANLQESPQQIFLNVILQLIKKYCKLADAQGYQPAHYMRYNPRYAIDLVEPATAAKGFKECILAMNIPALLDCLNLEDPKNDWYFIRHEILQPSNELSSIIIQLLAYCEKSNELTMYKPRMLTIASSPQASAQVVHPSDRSYTPISSITPEVQDFLKKLAAQGDIELEYAVAKIFSKVAAAKIKGSSESLYIRKLLEDAAAKGFAKAQYELGLLYESGKLVHQNFENAHYWYQCASAQQHQLATQRAAILKKLLTHQQAQSRSDEAKYSLATTISNDDTTARIAAARVVGASASASASAAAVSPKQHNDTKKKGKSKNKNKGKSKTGVAGTELAATASSNAIVSVTDPVPVTAAGLRLLLAQSKKKQ